MAAHRLLLLLVLWHCLVLSNADYYEDLGLQQGEASTDSQIKKAYRTMTKKYHPDHNPSEEAKEKYLVVSRAYEVLSDAKKRKIYDMKGDEGLKQLEDAKAGKGQHMDPFAAFFGGGQQRDRTRGQNVQMNLKVGLQDIYNGKLHTLSLKKQKLCRSCKGTGARSKSDMATCNRCQGRGHVVQRVQIAPGFVQQMQQPCPVCEGKGKKITTKCPACNGRKVTRGEANLEVLIEQGMPEGHEVVFEMEADESPDLLPGDVVVKIKTQKHPVFTRHGDDLSMVIKISLMESLVGFKKTVLHMDDHEVEVTRTAVTPHGHVMTLKNEGMPKHNVPSEVGELVITFEVVFPRTISAEQRDGFQALLGDAK